MTLSISYWVHHYIWKRESRYHKILGKEGVDVENNEDVVVKDKVSLEIN